MRNILFIIILLAASSCRQKHEVILSGTIDPGAYDTFQFSLRDGGSVTVIPLDSTKTSFSITMPCDTVQILYLTGVIGRGEEAWPYSQALLFEPGKKVLLHLVLGERQMTVTADDKDRDNRALIAYNTYENTMRRALWENTPKPEQSQAVLDETLSRADEIASEMRPSETVKKFLNIQSYLTYHQGMSDLRHLYRMDKMGKLPETAEQHLPAPDKVLDDPLALQFYNAGLVIISELKKQAKTPEEQIRLARETYTHGPLVDKIVRMILQNYVIDYDYTTRFDEGLERLRAMTRELADGGKEMVKQFEIKKYSIEGTSLPPAQVEDVEGNVYRLSDFTGKNLYIDLWASWCVPCCMEVPHLQKLEKRVKNPAVRFISISLDEDKDAWKTRMKELNMHGEQYIVVGKELASMLNVSSIPHFLIYDKDGRLVQYRADRPSAGEPLRKMLEGMK